MKTPSGTTRDHTPDDVHRAVEQARQASGAWGRSSVHHRVRYLRRLRSLLTDFLEDTVRPIIRDTGKPRVDALTGDLLVTLRFLRYYEKNAASILRPERRSSFLSAFREPSVVEHRPYGVVGIISPWNFPLQLTLVPALSALVAGNAVVMKPAEQTPLTGDRIRDLFNRAGGPDHLVSVLRGGPDVGRALVDAEPDKLFFTGGLETGKKIRKRAAERMIPVDLELGGKDPLIVLDDANLTRAAKATAWGAFCNAGQMCISVERAYVQREVLPEFLDRLLSETSSLRVGNGPDAEVGPLMHPEQSEVVRRRVEQAVENGATLQTALRTDGRCVHPIVLTDVDHDMDVMTEEIFGPVLGLMPFDSDREAVRLANDSKYGLNASVFGGDRKRARRIAGRLDVGSCSINNVITHVGNPRLPFGGNRSSGLGRYHGPEGLRAFTRPTSITVDRWGGDTEFNWFPYTRNLADSVTTLIRVWYGDEPFPRKLRHVIHLVKKAIHGEIK